MHLGRSSGETGKEGDSMSNVKTADKTDADEFTEDTVAARTTLGLESSMFGSVLSGADSGVKVRHSGWHGGMSLEGLEPGFCSSTLGVSSPSSFWHPALHHRLHQMFLGQVAPLLE